MQKREFTQLADHRLIKRGNKILGDLFSKAIHSIRQLSSNESEAKAFYRFLQNERISEAAIIDNLSINCQAACKGKYVLCLQDTAAINLSSHAGRIKQDNDLGPIGGKDTKGLGFFIHPSLVVDAQQCIPYGYAAVRIWNRPAQMASKSERKYDQQPMADKESFKWIEVSRQTQQALSGTVEKMVIIQDREGDIYEQFALIPDEQTDLLIRSTADRRLADGSKLYSCLSDQPAQGQYEIFIAANQKRKSRKAIIEVRYKAVQIIKTRSSAQDISPTVSLYAIEAKEINYHGSDKVCWRLLTTLPVTTIEMAMMCIEWYSWRWTIEEVFKILKKEGYNIEASELEHASSIRKMCLLIMETAIKLFLMRIAYAEPETQIPAAACFTADEQVFLEHQINRLEGKTQKQKNPYSTKDLKRYVWAIARMGGWKGYESNRHPGITTLWNGLKYFKAAMQGWETYRDVSTR